MIHVVEYRWIFLGASGILILLSIISIAAFGLKFGIDLKGGTEWQIAITDSVLTEAGLKEVFKLKTGVDAVVRKVGTDNFLFRLPVISEENHLKYRDALEKEFSSDFSERKFSTIGPSVSDVLRKRLFWGIAIVLLGISSYITWVFRKVSVPITSWKYGIVTLVTLFHDVIIPTGVFALFGKWSGIEVDTNFIVALLVVMGFSVHDTIVVFDRIRETLSHARDKSANLDITINTSITSTLARSINTSLTLFLVLLAILITGPSSLFYFTLTILIGTVIGTYSSIFVASPLLYLWSKQEKRV